jgi:hypothetical protein
MRASILRRNAGQLPYLGKPATVLFAFALDFEFHGISRVCEGILRQEKFDA